MESNDTPDTTEHEATGEGMPEAVSDAPAETEPTETETQASER